MPDRYLSLPRLRARRPGLGRAADPGRPRLPVPQLGAGAHGRVLPEPGRRHRVGAAAGRLGPDRARTTPSWPCCAPTSRRCWSRRADRAGRARATWCRSTSATSWSARCGTLLARLRRRPGGARRRSTTFFAPGRARSRPAPAVGADDERLRVHGARHRRRAVRRRAAAHRAAADRRSRPARSTRSRCAARSGSSRSAAATTQAERDGAARPVRRAGSAGSTRSSRSCGCSATPPCRASPARPRSTCALPCTYDFDVVGSRYLHALGAGTVPLDPAVLRHRVHPRAAPASGCEQVPWDCEAALRPAGRGVAADDRVVLPEHRLDPAGPRRARALADYRARHGLNVGGDRRSACSPRTGEVVVMSLDQVRAVADAVLYEGYLLYPYRASSRKNQSRWQFGVLGPPGAARAGLGEEPGMAMQCLLAGGHPARRHDPPALPAAPGPQVQRSDRTADTSPVDALTVAGATRAELGRGGRARDHAVAAPADGRRRLPVDGARRRGRRAARRGRGAVVGRVVRRRWPLAARVRTADRRRTTASSG